MLFKFIPSIVLDIVSKNKQINKQTNKHLVTTVLFCGQLSQNTWYTMVWFTNVAKAFHCLSIKREISSSCRPYLFLHHVWLCCPGMWMPPLSRVPCQLLLIVGGGGGGGGVSCCLKILIKPQGKEMRQHSNILTTLNLSSVT